jgi:hypothetical protein
MYLPSQKLDTGLQLYKDQRALRQNEGNANERKYKISQKRRFLNCFVIKTSIQVGEVLLKQAVEYAFSTTQTNLNL